MGNIRQPATGQQPPNLPTTCAGGLESSPGGEHGQGIEHCPRIDDHRPPASPCVKDRDGSWTCPTELHPGPDDSVSTPKQGFLMREMS